MFGGLGEFIYKRRWLVLLAGLALIIAGGVYGTSVVGKLKNGGFYDPDAESTQVITGMHEKLGQDESSLIVLFSTKPGTEIESRPDPVLSDEYKAEVEKVLGRIEGQEGTGKIVSFYNTGAQPLVSNEKSSSYAVVGFLGDEQEQSHTMERVRPLLTSDVLDVKLGGLPAFSQEITEQVEKDLVTAESLTFPVLAILLVLIFG